MYLGIDLGTSGVKALLIDEDQQIVAASTAPLPIARPHEGWSEQDPRDWIVAAGRAIGSLKASDPSGLASVRGIGLSGQMHGATLLDRAGSILRPCILWNDTRAHAEAAELDGDPQFRAVTGNIVFPGFTAPKLLWVRRHEPDIFDRIEKVLLPKDFLRHWLTGEFISEMSDAAGTAWLDVAARRWSEPLLAATGLGTGHMPALVEGIEPAGVLRAELSGQWGMRAGVTVAGGAGDNAASACGVGVIGAGQAFLSLGTSGVLFAATDAYRPNAASAVHTFCHALPGAWHQMGVILAATDALNWLAGITGKEAATLTEALGEVLEPPGGTVFLPYLGGERTPHNDALIRAALVGLAHETDTAELARAVLEGVAFAFRDCLEALKAAGTELERATAVGGGSRSHYWLKVLATVLDIPLDLPAEGDFGAAFGAARLGLVAAEKADPRTVFAPPTVARTIAPEKALKGAFDEAYQRYRALYPAIKGATS